MTLPYETIFSRTRGRISDMKELSLDENNLNEIWTERLRMVAGDERVIRKFASFNMDDEISDFADKEYVIGLFTLGMTIEWLKPKVDSAKFTARALGTKEEKNMQNPYKDMQSRLDTLQHEFSRKLASHGYINNSYVRGE